MLLIIIILVVLAFYYVSTMNRLRQTQVKISESLSGIDVALTKRYDSLTKMLDVAKSYADFEKTTMIEVIQIRQGMTMEERNAATASMDQAASQLRALAENYPQLGANANFVELQKGIRDVEEHLQAARRAYNANVSSLNQQIVTFPTSIVANACGITQAYFFEAEDTKRADVSMKF